MSAPELRDYHAPVWNEPVIMELSQPGRRGQLFPPPEPAVTALVGSASDLVPKAMRRSDAARTSRADRTRGAAPLSQAQPADAGHDEHLAVRHLHHEIQSASLRGGGAAPAAVHPLQPDDTLQGILQIDPRLRPDPARAVGNGPVHVPGRRRRRCRLHPLRGDPRLARRSSGELGAARRDRDFDPGASLQRRHRCGCRVQGGDADAGGERLPFGEALEGCRVRPHRGADDQQSRTTWASTTRRSTSGCGSSTRRAACASTITPISTASWARSAPAELGFDACMYMLHKTFGAPKGGGGPAVGAYGCTAELAPFLPGAGGRREGARYRLDNDRPLAPARCASSGAMSRRSLKAYAWMPCHGRRRNRRGLRPVGAGQQLHGRASLLSIRGLEPFAIPTTGNGAWR